MKLEFNKWVIKKAEKSLRTLQSPLPVKELAFQVIRFVAACGKSNPVSFILRPVAMHPKIKWLPGLVLTLMVAELAWWSPLPLGANSGGVPTINTVSEGDVVLVTHAAVQKPLENFVLTQKFGFFHSGLDMSAPVGTRVRAAMAGKVTEAVKNWYGYGNVVVIDHGNGFSSRYAHLSKIMVGVGDTADLNTIVGLVGSTGRSTGPHLHIEITNEGHFVDPAPILGI